ncbi:sensor histidine kinase [Thiohalophilus sp.]|uniref:sensor histidine kinase n=1 Tax=Thiohalophilus sp. TaxID=3028392 RepID=UPI002ACDF34B|nr:ATP-binding protein [Thiohalophilus sp.]MDZ7663347.1 ATP-binding protein [Thiohalophilus sp.]
MVRQRRITLSGLISLYAGGALVVLALILGVVMQQSISRVLDDALRDKAGALARQLAIVSLDSVLTYDYGTLERYVKDLGAGRDMVYVRVQREDGELLAEAGNRERAGDSSVITIAEPVNLAGRDIGEVLVAYDRRAVDQTVGLLTLAGLVGLLVLTVILFYLLRQLLRARLVEPVRALANSVNPMYTDAPLAMPLKQNVPEEIEQLAEMFSRLQNDIHRHIDELEQANRLARSATARLCQEQRLATIGQMAAGLAHGLNTPLGNIIGYAQQGSREIPDERGAHRFQVIERQARKCSQIVGDLLASARAPRTVIQRLDLDNLVRSTVTLIRPVIRDHGVTSVEINSWGPCWVYGDVSGLEQILFNLFNNAAQAGATALQLTLQCSEDEGVLLVQDNGSGIDNAHRKKIFEPFFTTKEAGTGTGLGLYLCRTLLQSMNGHIELVEDAAGQTLFRLQLPAAEAQISEKAHQV